MDYDENKKLEVEITENNFVENRINEKKSKRHRKNLRKLNLDGLDLAIIPVVVGVFVSLGFLFANLFKATAAVDAILKLSSIVGGIL